MGKSSPDPAPPRQLDVELQQILSQGPALLSSQQLLNPQFAGLDLRNLKLALEGAPGGKQTLYENISTDAWRNTRTGQISRTKPAPETAFGKDAGGLWEPYQMNETITREVDTPSSPGLYDILGTASERLGTIQNQANTRARTATVADLRQVNPQQAALYDSLAADAAAGLKAGDRLTPEQTYNIVNPIRADWARRGLGNSAPAQLNEAVQLFAGGNALGQQRRGNAASVAQMGNQMYSLPALTFSPDATGTAQNFLGFGSSYGQQPSILEQLGGYGSDLFNTNFNATSANNIAKANADNATKAGAASAAAGIGAALILACWAAREVFGERDPKWRQFRTWMLLRAPQKFRNWYLIHGPRWAARLALNPRAKTVVRRWMERRILEVNHAV